MSGQRFLACFLVGTLLTVPLSNLGVAQTPKDRLKALADLEHRFTYFEKDFLDFAAATNDGLEHELALNLNGIAQLIAQRTEAVEILYFLYTNAHCDDDKLSVSNFLKIMVNEDAESMEVEIRGVDVNLAHTKIPAVSQTALNMKNEMRSLKANLEAISAELRN